jgi:hypothetical protein
LAEWRKLFCGAMIVILPVAAVAQESARAMLHSDGTVWLNGNPAPHSSAIFPLDFIQTHKQSVATIDTDGSTVTVQPETIVQFNGDELVLDHGSLQVNTARAMKIRVNCINIVPESANRTRYEVADIDGKVTVAARENEVNIRYLEVTKQKVRTAASLEVTVHQGEQVIREEECGVRAKPIDVVDARGAILNDPWAIGTGGAAIIALTCWALCFKSDDPVSPSKP